MGKFGDVFGPESAARQLLIWQVAGQLIGAVMEPFVTEITTLVNERAPFVPLSPEAAATMVARHLMSEADGKGEAAKSGINASRFADLVKAAGEVPDLSMLVEAHQRGLLGAGVGGGKFPTLEDALGDTRLRPEWHGLVAKLAVQIPTVAEVMNAWLEGQIEEDEAHQRYMQAGGDPSWFRTSYNANGSAPTPVEAAHMANRGIIPWEGTGPDSISFHQAFLEGPWRNKWLKAMRELGIYLPPARTITAMNRSGAIDNDLALSLYKKLGLTPDLAAAMLKDAQHTKSAADKELAKGDIVTLYRNKVITEAQAVKMLTGLHYSEANAKYLLAVADVHKATSSVTSAIARARNLFVSHKLTEAATRTLLHDLGVDLTHINELLATWELEEAANVKVLTDAQITAAWAYEIMTQDEAIANLMVLGHTKYDSWVLLSIKNGEALPHKPPKGPNPIATT